MILQPGVPAISPDSLTNMGHPIERASVAESSTCVAGRTGPKIDTLARDLLGPVIVTLSSQAN